MQLHVMFEIIVFQEKPFYNKTLMVIVVQIVTYFSLLLNNKQNFFACFVIQVISCQSEQSNLAVLRIYIFIFDDILGPMSS